MQLFAWLLGESIFRSGKNTTTHSATAFARSGGSTDRANSTSMNSSSTKLVVHVTDAGNSVERQSQSEGDSNDAQVVGKVVQHFRAVDDAFVWNVDGIFGQKPNGHRRVNCQIDNDY